MAGNLIRVDRGDGNLIKLTQAEVDKFIAANPGSFVFGQSAPAAGSAEDVPDFEAMTLSELRDFAAAKGVDISDATRKADVIGRLQQGA